MDAPHPFALLAGRWRGRGEGSYPTIDPFTYDEELVVETVPARPIAHWRSRTIDAATAEPRHGESGFLRSTPAGIELVLAHSFGLVETATGTFAAGHLTLASTSIVGTETAKLVERVERRYDIAFDNLKGDTLHYAVSMAAVGQPLTHHLEATLRRD